MQKHSIWQATRVSPSLQDRLEVNEHRCCFECKNPSFLAKLRMWKPLQDKLLVFLLMKHILRDNKLSQHYTAPLELPLPHACNSSFWLSFKAKLIALSCFCTLFCTLLSQFSRPDPLIKCIKTGAFPSELTRPHGIGAPIGPGMHLIQSCCFPLGLSDLLNCAILTHKFQGQWHIIATGRETGKPIDRKRPRSLNQGWWAGLWILLPPKQPWKILWNSHGNWNTDRVFHDSKGFFFKKKYKARM